MTRAGYKKRERDIFPLRSSCFGGLGRKAEMRTLILAERRQASREFSKTHVGE
jgi:hypothetical protein